MVGDLIRGSHSFTQFKTMQLRFATIFIGSTEKDWSNWESPLIISEVYITSKFCHIKLKMFIIKTGYLSLMVIKNINGSQELSMNVNFCGRVVLKEYLVFWWKPCLEGLRIWHIAFHTRIIFKVFEQSGVDTKLHPTEHNLKHAFKADLDNEALM